MIRRLAPLAALAATGCATLAPQGASEAPQRYACAGGKQFTAAYVARKNRVDITAGGRIYILPQAISGSGIRYAWDGVELRAKGPQATLEGARGGPYLDCTTG